MEKRILVYRDEKDVKAYKSDYERARIYSQKIIDFLKNQNIEVSLNLVRSIIKENFPIAPLFQNRDSKKLQDLPEALKRVVESDNNKLIRECNALIQEAKRSMGEHDQHHVDFLKLDLIDGKVIITDEAIKEAEDLGSIYVDTDNRKKVYEKALAAKKALDELDQTIKEVYDDIDRVRGIAPLSGDGARILSVNYDGEVELDGYYLKYIH
ncbi:MAG: hypothetical protein PHI48_06270 [Bacteroidales bacterium]|nr:hypothetical protein [Bacteroidales bacterium]